MKTALTLLPPKVVCVCADYYECNASFPVVIVRERRIGQPSGKQKL